MRGLVSPLTDLLRTREGNAGVVVEVEVYGMEEARMFGAGIAGGDVLDDEVGIAGDVGECQHSQRSNLRELPGYKSILPT